LPAILIQFSASLIQTTAENWIKIAGNPLSVVPLDHALTMVLNRFGSEPKSFSRTATPMVEWLLPTVNEPAQDQNYMARKVKKSMMNGATKKIMSALEKGSRILTTQSFGTILLANSPLSNLTSTFWT
jgi:hypothetical protein